MATATEEQKTTRRATGGKGTGSRSTQKPASPAKAKQVTKAQQTALDEYAEHAKARAKDSTIPVNADLVRKAKAVKPELVLNDDEQAAISAKASSSKATSSSTATKPAARRASEGEPESVPAYRDKKGVTIKGHRAVFHASEAKPTDDLATYTGPLVPLGLYPSESSTEAIAKARAKHKLGKDAVIVTLNSRYVIRSAEPAESSSK